MTVFEMIEAQQGEENTAVWMVGQQLKDICRSDPHCAEIVAQDLGQPNMSLAECEKKIKAKADEIQKKTKKKCVCITTNVAEQIIREFYGLPEGQATQTPPPVFPNPSTPMEEDKLGILDLDDLLG